jgi:hypothetical protein
MKPQAECHKNTNDTYGGRASAQAGSSHFLIMIDLVQNQGSYVGFVLKKEAEGEIQHHAVHFHSASRRSINASFTFIYHHCVGHWAL